MSTDIQIHGGNQSLGLMAPTQLDALHRFAEIMAKGVATVPKHLQGNVSDCFAVAMQATRWGLDPFAVGQKTHLINGTLGYEAQLVHAVLKTSGAIDGRMHYEWTGDGQSLACRCGAVPSGEDAVVWGPWLKAADQTVKNSPLWKTDPAQQLAYLASKKWARLYAPGAILGVYTVDELQDARDMGSLTRVDEPRTIAEIVDRARREELPSETVDTETGEIISATASGGMESDETGAPTAATVIGMLQAAATIQEVNVALDMLRSINATSEQRREVQHESKAAIARITQSEKD